MKAMVTQRVASASLCFTGKLSMLVCFCSSTTGHNAGSCTKRFPAKGRVTNENGQPVSRATITVKGSATNLPAVMIMATLKSLSIGTLYWWFFCWVYRKRSYRK